MPPQDLLKAVRRRPFEGFRLHVSDGTVYEIRHPELLVISPRSALVFVPHSDPKEAQIADYEIVDLRHIVRLEPLPTKAEQGASS
jgi:hypothetical protein